MKMHLNTLHIIFFWPSSFNHFSTFILKEKNYSSRRGAWVSLFMQNVTRQGVVITFYLYITREIPCIIIISRVLVICQDYDSAMNDKRIILYNYNSIFTV